ncbi:Lrp/AsnC family transcriptional regulator [Helicobacter pylori]
MQRHLIRLRTLRNLLPCHGSSRDNLHMSTVPTPSRVVDDLDARLIALLSASPTIGVLGASRELGVARGTVQARLDRLRTKGVIRTLAPTIDPAALGYPVTALCTLEIRQRLGHQAVVDHLTAIPEVLEIHSTTGVGDLIIRIVATDNADLGRVIDMIIDDVHVVRASTSICLVTHMEMRTGPLVEAAAHRQ